MHLTAVPNSIWTWCSFGAPHTLCIPPNRVLAEGILACKLMHCQWRFQLYVPVTPNLLGYRFYTTYWWKSYLLMEIISFEAWKGTKMRSNVTRLFPNPVRKAKLSNYEAVCKPALPALIIKKSVTTWSWWARHVEMPAKATAAERSLGARTRVMMD